MDALNSPTALPTESAQADFLLSALRGAVLRAKLDINEFTSIGIALRDGFISPDGAMEWLKDSGLIGQVLDEAAS